METLIAKFKEDLNRIDTTFVRYLHDEIDWGARLIAILGGRGVGKSTHRLFIRLRLYDRSPHI